MRLLKYFVASVAVLCPLASHAGLVYGSLTLAGNVPAVNVHVDIRCGNVSTGNNTDAHGQYRIDVSPQGQCTLTVPSYGGASAVVFSKQAPSLYNFQLVQPPGRPFELRAK